MSNSIQSEEQLFYPVISKRGVKKKNSVWSVEMYATRERKYICIGFGRESTDAKTTLYVNIRHLRLWWTRCERRFHCTPQPTSVILSEFNRKYNNNIPSLTERIYLFISSDFRVNDYYMYTRERSHQSSSAIHNLFRLRFPFVLITLFNSENGVILIERKQTGIQYNKYNILRTLRFDALNVESIYRFPFRYKRV